MNINQIYALVNTATKNAYGGDAIEILNAQDIVSLGDQVFSSATNKETWFDSLITRVIQTVISNRAYSQKGKSVIKEKLEYGAIVQKIYTEPTEAIETTAWSIKDGDLGGTFKVNIPVTKQKLFDKRSTFMFTYTISDVRLKPAFLGDAGLSALIASIVQAMENQISVSTEQLVNLCIANFMAEKINDDNNNGVGAINLLELYNTQFSTTLKAADCLQDMDFLKYASFTITEHLDNMANMTRIYNMENYLRHTPKQHLNFMVLSSYANAAAMYLESDTYHQELVKLPNYEKISFWQGMGEVGDWEDRSSINVKLASTGETVAQSGILAFGFDVDALGVYVWRDDTASEYDKFNKITHTQIDIDRGYFNDLSENAIVFYVAD